MEEVEGRIIVAEQIIADDIIPDKVAPAQAVEGRGHIAPVEEAARRQLLEQGQIAFVDEHLEVARQFEIDLRGKESHRLDLVGLAACGEQDRKSTRLNSSH